jgi:sRNA-binding carbon storage regulator CsrA
VYLGFQADQETEILREELYQAMVRDGDRQPVE